MMTRMHLARSFTSRAHSQLPVVSACTLASHARMRSHYCRPTKRTLSLSHSVYLSVPQAYQCVSRTSLAQYHPFASIDLMDLPFLRIPFRVRLVRIRIYACRIAANPSHKHVFFCVVTMCASTSADGLPNFVRSDAAFAISARASPGPQMSAAEPGHATNEAENVHARRIRRRCLRVCACLSL